jgi:hypothetical protein
MFPAGSLLRYLSSEIAARGASAMVAIENPETLYMGKYTMPLKELKENLEFDLDWMHRLKYSDPDG